MESWFGGGILFAVAAVLWLAYLVPNWLQRREYIASERNAVRLQQTIRVLAETAEAPEALRLENAAKARIAASRLTKQQVLAEARAAVDVRAAAAARLRRTRLAVTAVLVAALVVLGWQGWLAVTAGVAAASGIVAVIAALVAVGAGALQHGINTTARERAARAAAEERARRAEVARERVSRAPQRRVRQAPSSPSRTWTPQPLPQPLAQVRREAMLAAVRAEALGQSVGAAEENVRIAEVEERRRVAARAAAGASSVAPVERMNARDREPVGVTQSTAPVSAPAMTTSSRYASMGIVGDDASGVAIDLDSALARRRAS